MNEKLPITVIILTFNEEANIEPCILSVMGWASEVVVLDSGSVDKTIEIVKKYQCCVYSHPFENYSKQRNWAQSNLPIGNEWVFHIDADERATQELEKILREFFRNDEAEGISGLLVRRRIEFLGRHIKHGGIYPTYHCRIYKKSRGYCEEREYDQHFKVDGPVRQLDADLIERTAATLSSWTIRHDRWAHMEALHLLRSCGVRSERLVQARLIGSPIQRRRWWRASVYERSPKFLRATVYFFVRYIIRFGFLDGIPGLIYHVLHGFWFRFYVDACLYELNQTRNR